MLGKLFSKEKTSEKSKMPLPENIQSLMNAGGRVDFDLLAELALNNKLLEFEAFLLTPLIVGSSIASGEIHQQSSAPQSTQMFNPNHISKEFIEEIAQNAVFPLMKGPFAKHAQKEVFSVGRTSGNDLVIPDYAVSATHARFGSKGKQYWVKDCGSTNGTKLNGEVLQANKAVRIKDKDLIAFGRYQFHFYTPKSFTIKLRQK
jgi:hypothetical protein